jgi:anaerobic selenocysteine-containing dehydrogenase
MGISEGDVITISTPRGSVDVLAYPHPGVPTDVIGVPVGQGHRAAGRYAEGRGANIYSVLSPTTDTRSGALAWASTRAEIHRTGEWIRLPKFENTLTRPVEDEDGVVIRLTPIDS